MSEPTAEQIEAYDAGRAAFDGGAELTACPYPAGELRLLWVRGFVLAQRDARVDELAKGA